MYGRTFGTHSSAAGAPGFRAGAATETTAQEGGLCQPLVLTMAGAIFTVCPGSHPPRPSEKGRGPGCQPAQTPCPFPPTLPAWAPLRHLASCCALELARKVGRLCRGRFPVPPPHIPRGLLSPWMLLGLQTWSDGIISPWAAQNTAANSPAKWTVLTSGHYDSIIPSKSLSWLPLGF